MKAGCFPPNLRSRFQLSFDRLGYLPHRASGFGHFQKAFEFTAASWVP